jgi:hypothetical protein
VSALPAPRLSFVARLLRLARHALPSPVLALLVLAALALALAGCGGDGDVRIEAPGGAGTPAAPASPPADGVATPLPGAPTLGGVPSGGTSDPGAPFAARAGSPFGDDEVVLALAAAGIAATRQHEAVGCAAGDETTGYLYSALVGGEPLLFDLWVYATPRLLADSGWSVEDDRRARGCGRFGSDEYPAYVMGNVVLTLPGSPPRAPRERLVAAFLTLGGAVSAPPAAAPAAPGATFPFAAADLLASLAEAGFAYAPDGESVACRAARAVGIGYGSPEASALLIWVYASPEELRSDWVVAPGQRPRYHLDDAGECVQSGFLYWNENALLALEDAAWATADAERFAVVAAFLSLARPAAAQ